MAPTATPSTPHGTESAELVRRSGGRPGFGGLRPLLFQIVSYVPTAIVNAVLTLTAVGVAVHYYQFDGGWRLTAAGVAAAALAVAASYLTASWLTFRSSLLFRRPTGPRFLIVQGIGFAIAVAVFTAVSSAMLARGGASPGGAATGAQAAALAVSGVAVFVLLRRWAYRPEPARSSPPPPLAFAYARTVSQIDPELASIAAGERHVRTLWQSRSWGGAYVLVAALLIAYGWYSTSYLGMNNGDGTARVTQAFAVIFSRDPHLGVLSLIWPPIPALVDIPLVLLLRPFGQAFLAGSIMGGLFMAGAVVLMYHVLREVGAGPRLSLVLTLAFVSQQHIYQSAAAGLSEAPFAMFLLASMLAYLRWLKSEDWSLLTLAGLMAAGAMMSRYEAMFWVAAMAGGIVIALHGGIPGLPFFRGQGDREPAPTAAIAGSLWAFIAPLAFVVMLWMWINFQIKGDPFFFLTGPGSTRTAPDTARVALAAGQSFPLDYAYHSVSGTISLAWDRVWFLSPLLILATALLVLYALRTRRTEIIAIGIVAWSITAFPTITGYTGALPPWVRYWYWVVPMGLMLAAYGVAHIRLPGLRAMAAGAVVVLAFLPNVRVFMQTYDGFPAEQPTHAESIRNALLTTPDLASVQFRQVAVREFRRAAEAVDEYTDPDAPVMLDVIGPGGAVPMFSRRPGRLVTTTDRDFESDFLSNTRATVDYILVPFPSFDNFSRSVVLQTHDGIWEGDLPWAELVVEVDGPTQWRLYRVQRPPPPPPDEPASGG